MDFGSRPEKIGGKGERSDSAQWEKYFFDLNQKVKV